MSYIRKYGAGTDIYFPLIKVGSNNYAASGDYTYTSGDIKITKDGGTPANPTNSPTALTMGNGTIWVLSLTATEMQAYTVVVTIIDAATKAVEDQMLVIETWGSGNGEILTDEWSQALLDIKLESGADTGGRSVRNALRALRNKWAISGTTLTVYKEDDTTSAWTSTLTATAGVNPITTSDPA